MKDLFPWDELTKYLLIVVGIMIIAYINYNVTPVTTDTVSSGAFFQDLFSISQNKFTSLLPSRGSLVGLEIFLSLVALVFFGGSVWFGLRAQDIHHYEDEKYKPIPVEEIEAKEKMVQWQVVLNHINSESPAEWKLGILEADNMLDAILESEGYRGESIGEKLKVIDPGDLQSYNEAWEAHKVRNQIAHEGAATMDFSKKMARDTVLKFEKVFKELGYI